MAGLIVLLFVFALAVSLVVGFLAGLSPRDMAVQTLAIFLPGLGFAGLLSLL